jgi:hypothetical protein
LRFVHAIRAEEALVIGRFVASLVLAAAATGAGACAEPGIAVSIGSDRWLFFGGDIALCDMSLTGGQPALDIDATDDVGNVLQLTWSSEDATFGEAELDLVGSPAFWTASNQNTATPPMLRFESLDGRTVRFAGHFTRSGTAEGGEADGTIEVTCPG